MPSNLQDQHQQTPLIQNYVGTYTLYSSQIAQSSVHGLMAGYTNFACGHLANKNGMISVDELISSESTTKLTENHDSWQRLLAITGQPSFLNPDKIE